MDDNKSRHAYSWAIIPNTFFPPANHLKCRKSRILRPKKTCHYIEMRRVKKLFAIFCDNSQNIVTCHKSHATCRSWHAICRSSYTTRRKKLRQVATRHNILRQVATGHDWLTTQLTFGRLHTMAISLQITTMATLVLYPTTTPSPTFKLRQMLHQHSTDHWVAAQWRRCSSPLTQNVGHHHSDRAPR